MELQQESREGGTRIQGLQNVRVVTAAKELNDVMKKPTLNVKEKTYSIAVDIGQI